MDIKENTPYDQEWNNKMHDLPKSEILKLFQDLVKEMELLKDSFSKVNSSYSLLLSKHKVLESQQEELIEAFKKQLEVDDFKNPELDLLIRKARLKDFQFEFNIYEEKDDKDDDK